jgi:hypothetical protein
MRPAAALLLVASLAAACANPGPSTPVNAPVRVAPGYHGPLPSVEARALLKELRGRSFEDVDGVYGGGKWVVGAFGVVPNPVSGKGPVIYIDRSGPVQAGDDADGRRWIPVETDGDVARFYEVVTGQAPIGLPPEPVR